MTAGEHREWVATLSQAEIDHAWDEYRRHAGESERDAAIADTNHVLELETKKTSS